MPLAFVLFGGKVDSPRGRRYNVGGRASPADSPLFRQARERDDRRQRDQASVPRVLPQGGPRGRALVAARAAQRPDADVHQRRHGAVQERLHRPGDAPLRARRDLAEVRPRRRQAQRPRQRRLHRAPPHLLRDARQLLVRRLLQGARDRARLEPGHQGVRPRQEAPRRSPSITRTTRRTASGRSSPASPTTSSSASRPPTTSGPWATPVPAVRAPRSSTITAPTSRAALRARRTPTATASSRSGISSSCSSSSLAPASASRCPSPRSTPAWASSASRRCCRARTTTTRPISSAR